MPKFPAALGLAAFLGAAAITHAQPAPKGEPVTTTPAVKPDLTPTSTTPISPKTESNAVGDRVSSPIPVPARAASGKSLVVPAGQAGAVYHVHQMAGSTRAQFKLTGQAGAARVEFQAQGVAGYLVPGADENQGELKFAAWRIPAKQNHSRFEPFAAKEWFDADNHPDITFVLTRAESRPANASVPPGAQPARPFSATLHGELSIRGVTRTLAMPAQVTFVDEGPTTASVGKGAVAYIRTQRPIEIRLSDFGITGASHNKPDDAATIEFEMIFLTVAPEDQPAPKPREPGVANP